MAPVVETERLTKRYRRGRGIEALTLRVERGEVFGFLGPNGAGKTTTIRTLLGLLRPTSGTARLFGLDARRDGLAVRARTGNLPGEFAFAPRMSGRAPALAERLQADLDRPIGELSRGNREKVGIIQALFHAPDLLVLDEPTSGLDPIMQREFLALVGEERARGTTVFLSSHDLDEVQRVCDRVGMVREGRLIAVEEVARMRERAHHEVRVRFAVPVHPEEVAAVPGVEGLRVEGDGLAFRAVGDLDPVVKALARHPVCDLEITHPTLEELFLRHYRPAEEGR
ncbi:MAG: ATP-binding cassette domain-containing protein [Thermoleophilia bacterium]|nr:ATP-binding cassette domain-containing protein [Thermoleophilia bacterium]